MEDIKEMVEKGRLKSNYTSLLKNINFLYVGNYQENKERRAQADKANTTCVCLSF